MNQQSNSKSGAQGHKFGSFGGVFTPSLLTILGVIMFLRFPMVTGYAGLWHALLILACAKVITLITALSISTISTNMRVKGGGAYYLISRSLGVEFGGVIAVFFYVAQAIAVTLYVVGFSEAVYAAFPSITMPHHEFATLTNLAVLLSVYIGAGWTIKVQYGILGIMMLSILSFILGAVFDFDHTILRDNLAPQWSGDNTFFPVFAIFFPAVTGLMAGLNMSGDLRDPSRSLPRGILAAIVFSGLLYVVIAFLLAGSVPRAELLGSGFVFKNKALVPTLVYAGVFCATLSSALGSMMGAPRILQAFARDDVFKRLRFLGRGSGPSGEPRRAILLTFLIAQTGIIAGDLDTVAPIITMFFLMTYGTVNLACFYEIRSRNPSFRPTFRLNHWFLALLGALGCLAIMFLINLVWATAAILLATLLYLLIARAEIRVKWGDIDSGMAYQRARTALLRLEQERYHPKNWRPSILALSGGAHNRLHLAEYACWLTSGRGMVSIAQVIRGRFAELIDRQREAENLLRKFIRKEQLPAFPVVMVDKNIHNALQALLQCHGIGGLRPNTVLLGWSEDPRNSVVFSEILQTTMRMRRNIVIVACKQKSENPPVRDGAINIWWTTDANGALLLLLAFLLKKNQEWQACPLRIIRTLPDKADVHNVAKEMQEMLSESRIEADLLIVPTAKPIETLRERMIPSAVLLAGFEPVEEDAARHLTPYLQETVDLPGDILLVYNAGDVSLQA